MTDNLAETGFSQKKPTQQSPVVHRRNKLSARVFEQI